MPAKPVETAFFDMTALLENWTEDFSGPGASVVFCVGWGGDCFATEVFDGNGERDGTAELELGGCSNFLDPGFPPEGATGADFPEAA